MRPLQTNRRRNPLVFQADVDVDSVVASVEYDVDMIQLQEVFGEAAPEDVSIPLAVRLLVFGESPRMTFTADSSPHTTSLSLGILAVWSWRSES